VILLDTTVLAYAVGTDHPLRRPARDLVAEISQGRIIATTTVEVVQEFCHVRARRRGRADALGVARDVVQLLTPLTTVTEADLEQGLVLFEQHPALGSFDAVLAATTLRCEATLVSADRAFTDGLGERYLDLAADPLTQLGVT